MDSFSIKNLIDKTQLDYLKKYISSIEPTLSKDENDRQTYSGGPVLYSLLNYLLPTARKYFKNENIIPSFACTSIYNGSKSLLKPHMDTMACTYGIDLCVSQTRPWEIYVNDKSYLLEEGEAIFYYGEDMVHWRDKVLSDDDKVCNAFIFYVDPDHWYHKTALEDHESIQDKISKKNDQYAEIIKDSPDGIFTSKMLNLLKTKNTI